MVAKRCLGVAALGLVSLAAWQGRAGAVGSMFLYASCADGVSVNVSLGWSEVPNYPPTERPEWVGFDVRRRTVANCGAWVRVNAEPFPRTPGKSETYNLVDVAPVTGTLLEYQVLAVDAERNEVPLGPECDFWCSPSAWVSCPDQSAPLTHGTIDDDMGWALLIVPCASTCYGGFYYDGPLVEELRPYVRTGVEIRFFGGGYCGTVEGCGMNIERYELAPCNPVPTRPQSWARLKGSYR